MRQLSHTGRLQLKRRFEPETVLHDPRLMVE